MLLSRWTDNFHNAENPNSIPVPEIPGKINPRRIADITSKISFVTGGLDLNSVHANDGIIRQLGKPEQAALGHRLIILADIARATGEYDKSKRIKAMAEYFSPDLQPYSMN